MRRGGISRLWRGMDNIRLDRGALDVMLPLHLRLAADGVCLAAGRSLRRFLPPQMPPFLGGALRSNEGRVGTAAALRFAAAQHARLFLRLPDLHEELRGHVVVCEAGFLLNFGFSVGLREAVAVGQLTDTDFTPCDLAMEVLFLHEANAAVMAELSWRNRQLDAARSAAERQAFSDPLTGLANRRGFDLAAAVVARDARGFALIHLDLDLFKAVNDTLGHGAGDKVLQHVAEVLRQETRAEDSICRVGGDEFILILPGLQERAGLVAMARRLIARIEAPLVLAEGEVRISASMGIALSRDYNPADMTQMSAAADAALYQAKRSGRGQAVFAAQGGAGADRVTDGKSRTRLA